MKRADSLRLSRNLRAKPAPMPVPGRARSRKGKQTWHKRMPTAPVTGMADLDPFMVSLIADGHALAR